MISKEETLIHCLLLPTVTVAKHSSQSDDAKHQHFGITM
jgi:hypothetical protein